MIRRTANQRLNELLVQRSRSRSAFAGALVTTAFGLVVACADSTVLGTESPSEAGTSVPTAVDDGGDVLDGATPSPEAAPDAEAGTRICSVDGFCPTIVPKGQNLVGVWGDGTGVVWAVSVEGAILRWDGAAWAIHHQVEGEGFSIWGSGPTDVWVATSTGLLRGEGSTSSGLVFAPVTELPGDPNVPLLSIWGTGPSDIWAVGHMEDSESWPPMIFSRVLHFGGSDPDAAATGWTSDDDLAAQGVGFRSVWGSTGSGVWIDGLGGDELGSFIRLYRRPAGADTFILEDLPADISYAIGIRGAGTSSDLSVMISAELGVPEETVKTSWRGTSADNGQTFEWTYAKHEYWKRDFLAYWGTAADDSWGVGAYGLVSHWDGTTWKQAILRVGDVPIGKTFRAIWGKSNDDFWVVGDEVALHKTNAGKP